jgi:hypothetical protein
MFVPPAFCGRVFLVAARRIENRQDRSMTRHGWICSAVHTSSAGKMRNRVQRTIARHSPIKNRFRRSVHKNRIVTGKIAVAALVKARMGSAFLQTPPNDAIQGFLSFMNPYYPRKPWLKMSVPIMPFRGQEFSALLINGFTAKRRHPAS